MKIFGMCLVKNEEDIIEQSLRAAAVWCHEIYVFDNGSDDDTWERVQDLARELPEVVPYKQDDTLFHSGVREEILHAFADRARVGDWWCILDADEFYIDDPRAFLERVPSRYEVVWKQDISYFFTTEDLESYRRNPALYSANVPIEQRLRYYNADWSEIRFFRHPDDPYRPRIPWESPRTFPRRIRLKHFQYRSPEQIQNRIDTRRQGIESGVFAHESRRNWVPGGGGDQMQPGPSSNEEIPQHWTERVISTSGLIYDARDGTYAEGKPWVPPRDPGRIARLRARTPHLRAAVIRMIRRIRKKLVKLSTNS